MHITYNCWLPSISPLHTCGKVVYCHNYYRDVEGYFAEVYNNAETRDRDNPPYFLFALVTMHHEHGVKREKPTRCN
jgi:hypothetical protein